MTDYQTHPSIPLWRKILRWILRGLTPALWFIAALLITILAVGSLIPGFMIALGLVGLVAYRHKIRWTFAVGIALCLLTIFWRSSLNPSHDRNWWEELTRLPKITLEGDNLTITDVRDFTWNKDGTHKANWETRQYQLQNLKGAELILEPFPGSSLMAHTMISFDFGEDGHLLLSIEARKEIGEEYGPIPGGLNRFELIYLFMDEKDGLGIRANKGHELYAFPARIDPIHLRAFFLSLCASANNLHNKPMFYHILEHNCTTVWIQHADLISNDPVGIRLESIFNGKIAHYLLKKNIIDTDLDYEEAKEKFRIDEQIRNWDETSEFSKWIRENR
ncbi:MAG: hypothetical protein CMO55_18705 [Verrucomicrobiales bacterium]|nr:hypothetical protein [Verrucomicrobiales bacterium]